MQVCPGGLLIVERSSDVQCHSQGHSLFKTVIKCSLIPDPMLTTFAFHSSPPPPSGQWHAPLITTTLPTLPGHGQINTVYREQSRGIGEKYCLCFLQKMQVLRGLVGGLRAGGASGLEVHGAARTARAPILHGRRLGACGWARRKAQSAAPAAPGADEATRH